MHFVPVLFGSGTPLFRDLDSKPISLEPIEVIETAEEIKMKKFMVEQSEVRTLLDSRSEAIRIKDIDRLMAHYAPDIIYFDLVPPLQYVGAAALRGRFLEWFEGYQSGIGQEIHDLNILVSGDIAVTSMLIQSGGTLKNGQETSLWVRATSCCQRSNQTWLVTHEHISLPVDLRSGQAALDLVP